MCGFSVVSLFCDVDHSVLSNVGNHFMCGPRGAGWGKRVQTPLKNHKHIGFPCNTGLEPLKNHKATKPAFIIGSSSFGLDYLNVKEKC